MTKYTTVLLALASLASAQNWVGLTTPPAPRDTLMLPGLGSSLYGSIALVGGCDASQRSCDGKCMPLTGNCCGLGNGSYCELGYTCGKSGCCPIGKTCNSDGPLTCTAGKTLCGNVCITQGSVCCDKSAGTWCNSGETCAAGGKCTPRSGSSSTCSASQKLCGSGCIPTDAVCCNNGFFCDAGEICSANNKCAKADSICKRKSKSKSKSKTKTKSKPKSKPKTGGGDDCDDASASAATHLAPGLLGLIALGAFFL
ncbi:hypothetical protein PT974_11064 [Cladobotryum mycophilum]|uniref:Uncharacterized protein n=1 Tax=Cladobotryum mycophilum TaxID=491253 RepID=A0ABR0SCH3_9HYPO